MGVVTTYPFTTPANYTVNNAEIDSGVGKLSLVDLPGLIYNLDFANDTGYTYDNTKTEFVGGVMRQKSQRPANAIFGSKFATKDGNWGEGSLIGTLFGSGAIVGGEFVSSNSNNSYLQYDGASNMPSGNKGCVRFKFTPNYSGNSGFNNYIFASSQADNNIANLIRMIHINTTIRIDIWDSTGTVILTSQTGNTWNPTSGQTYEFEFNWDCDAGEHRLFIDGVLIGGTKAGTGTLGARGIIRLGKDYTSSTNQGSHGSYDDLVIFDEPQHTAAYTPGYTLPDFDYLADPVQVPSRDYVGLGIAQSAEDLQTTQANEPRFLIQGLYWTGSNWALSNLTYAQASPLADIQANIGALFLVGTDPLVLHVIFGDGNTQMQISDYNLEYTGQQYAAEGSILTNNTFVANELTDFQAEETTPTDTAIKYTICVNAQDKYWNGSAWVDSDGTFAQANTLAEIQANIDTLLPGNSTIKLRTILTSADRENETPEIDSITVTYDFGVLEPTLPTQCQVYGWLKDSENQPITNATVRIRPNRDADEYKEAASRIISETISKITDADGFFSFNLIISSDFEVATGADPMKYVLEITPTANAALPIFKNGLEADGETAKRILFEVPNVATLNITDQIEAA